MRIQIPSFSYLDRALPETTEGKSGEKEAPVNCSRFRFPSLGTAWHWGLWGLWGKERMGCISLRASDSGWDGKYMRVNTSQVHKQLCNGAELCCLTLWEVARIQVGAWEREEARAILRRAAEFHRWEGTWAEKPRRSFYNEYTGRKGGKPSFKTWQKNHNSFWSLHFCRGLTHCIQKWNAILAKDCT